jgi:predicted CopG family antitoxin
MTIDHGEPKKSRHFTLTDTAYAHLKNIAHDARQSLSETVERLIRSTPTWEGSATLSDGAFSMIEDYSTSEITIEGYEGFRA